MIKPCVPKCTICTPVYVCTRGANLQPRCIFGHVNGISRKYTREQICDQEQKKNRAQNHQFDPDHHHDDEDDHQNAEFSTPATLEDRQEEEFYIRRIILTVNISQLNIVLQPDGKTMKTNLCSCTFYVKFLMVITHRNYKLNKMVHVKVSGFYMIFQFMSFSRHDGEKNFLTYERSGANLHP